MDGVSSHCGQGRRERERTSNEWWMPSIRLWCCVTINQQRALYALIVCCPFPHCIPVQSQMTIKHKQTQRGSDNKNNARKKQIPHGKQMAEDTRTHNYWTRVGIIPESAFQKYRYSVENFYIMQIHPQSFMANLEICPWWWLLWVNIFFVPVSHWGCSKVSISTL